MVKDVLKIKSLDYHETFSHVIKMNVFMNHVCIGNGLLDFEIQIKFQLMTIIMEVGKNETCIRFKIMVVNLIMKTFFMEFQT
jgi:hypothetical protein